MSLGNALESFGIWFEHRQTEEPKPPEELEPGDRFKYGGVDYLVLTNYCPPEEANDHSGRLFGRRQPKPSDTTLILQAPGVEIADQLKAEQTESELPNYQRHATSILHVTSHGDTRQYPLPNTPTVEETVDWLGHHELPPYRTEIDIEK